MYTPHGFHHATAGTTAYEAAVTNPNMTFMGQTYVPTTNMEQPASGSREHPTYLQQLTRAQEARGPRREAWLDPNASQRSYNPESGQQRTPLPYEGISYHERPPAPLVPAPTRPHRNARSASVDMQRLLA